jgi:hypothetical protein
MAKPIRTRSLKDARSDNATTLSEPWTNHESIRSLDSRRLGLLFVLTFCAITGARPVAAGFVQQSIVTPVFLPVETQRDALVMAVSRRT